MRRPHKKPGIRILPPHCVEAGNDKMDSEPEYTLDADASDVDDDDIVDDLMMMGVGDGDADESDGDDAAAPESDDEDEADADMDTKANKRKVLQADLLKRFATAHGRRYGLSSRQMAMLAETLYIYIALKIIPIHHITMRHNEITCITSVQFIPGDYCIVLNGDNPKTDPLEIAQNVASTLNKPCTGSAASRRNVLATAIKKHFAKGAKFTQ